MLGATMPTFDRPRSIGQLSAPDVEDCLRLIKQAFDARRLTNDGLGITIAWAAA